MCLDERNTDSRGRPFAPAFTARRTRAWRRSLVDLNAMARSVTSSWRHPGGWQPARAAYCAVLAHCPTRDRAGPEKRTPTHAVARRPGARGSAPRTAAIRMLRRASFLLAFLAEDVLVGVLHTLALVRLGRAER